MRRQAGRPQPGDHRPPTRMAHRLGAGWSLVASALLVAATASAVIGSDAAPAAAQGSDAQQESRLLELHNQERVARGLAPLQRDAGLDAIAREWSAEMARTGRFEHRPDLGAQIEARVTPDWRRWGENIAAGDGSDADELHRALMDSASHRANILQPDYNRVGIGARRDDLGRLWLTVDFLEGPPLVAPPAPPPVPSVPAGEIDVLVLESGGRVRALGGSRHLGDAAGHLPSRPAVALEPTDGSGYWLATAAGDVLAYGSAVDHGDAGGLALAAPVVDVAGTVGAGGYWLAAADGGIFTYGDAPFLGSAGGLPLVAPIVGMAATPSGHGYWLAAADGGIFTYGDAPFLGSAAGRASAPVTDVVARGRGYVLVAEDGSAIAFGPGGPVASPPVDAARAVVAGA